MTIRVKGPYLDAHDLWRGVYWRREGDGLRIYWCPLWCVVVRIDAGPLHLQRQPGAASADPPGTVADATPAGAT